jgi:hypothetical protein
MPIKSDKILALHAVIALFCSSIGFDAECREQAHTLAHHARMVPTIRSVFTRKTGQYLKKQDIVFPIVLKEHVHVKLGLCSLVNP